MSDVDCGYSTIKQTFSYQHHSKDSGRSCEAPLDLDIWVDLWPAGALRCVLQLFVWIDIHMKDWLCFSCCGWSVSVVQCKQGDSISSKMLDSQSVGWQKGMKKICSGPQNHQRCLSKTHCPCETCLCWASVTSHSHVQLHEHLTDTLRCFYSTELF